ncbi:MAG: CRTAC1 family protein [Bacteroidota bacterium]
MSAPDWFEEIAASAGIDFTHVRTTASQFYLPEIMAGGVAWLDIDNDGWMDLYLIQGGDIESEATQPGNKLYRNINGERFEDITTQAGVGDTGYGMGAAAGDFDNDGDTDLYVTNIGPNVLYRNNGDGTFSDVSSQYGVDHAGWGSSAVFADYDGDGWADLYVVNYINWAPTRELECFSGGTGRDYCHPDNYRAPAVDVLYKNNRGQRFDNVSRSAGIAGVAANGLGIVPGDFNSDGHLDFYVANDGNPNQLWINNADGTFEDKGLLSGTAVNRQGTAEAGMGVAAFDLEHDGDLDLFLTHLRDESNTLYRNDNGNFQDVTLASSLSSSSLPYTGFGLGVADFNNDGHLDIYVANGKVGRGTAPATIDPFAEPNQLYSGKGNGQFDEVQPAGGLAALPVATSRGTALADFNNDGYLDLAIVNSQEQVHLLRNLGSTTSNWMGFMPVPAAGVRVKLEMHDGAFYGYAQPGGSYQSSNDPRVHFGLPSTAQVSRAVITWPDGTELRIDAPATNQYHTVQKP